MGKLGVGKPQKSRRHKKVQQFEELADGCRIKQTQAPEDQKINSRPLSLEQEVPRRIKDIQTFKEKWKGLEHISNRKKKKKVKLDGILGSNKIDNQKGMSRPLKPVPNFKKRVNESNRSFFKRVDRKTQEVLHQSQLEEEYNVDFDNREDGQVVVKKRAASKKKQMHLKKKDDAKKEKKIQRKLNGVNDFHLLRDDVKFGEVVEQPPTLTAKPRKSSVVESRPGKKSLLLKEIIRDNSSLSVQAKSTERQLGQSVKRKHLSMAQQVRLDAERQRVVNVYRDLKAKKMKIFD